MSTNNFETFVSSQLTHDGEVKRDIEPFLLLPRNEKFFRGQMRYPAIKDRMEVVLTLFILLGGLVGLGYYLDQESINAQLAAGGIMTAGRVIARYSSSGRNTSYSLLYQFQAALRDKPALSYRHTQQVTYGAYASHPEGAPVIIAFAPDDPDTSALAGPDRDNFVDIQGLLMLPFVAIAAVGFVFYVAPIVKDRSLAAKGRIIRGEIVQSEGHMISGKHAHYNVSVVYTFVSPMTGARLQKREEMTRADLRPVKLHAPNTKLPGPATPVAVLYADDQRYKML